MFAMLGALSRIVTTPPETATPETVAAACALVRELMGAEDAYVIRSGDPYFVRLASELEPTAYEIKQRGYWYAWRELAANPAGTGCLLTVRERLVEELLPLAPGTPATHAACILPASESNSELLIVRGAWPEGLTPEQALLLETLRPLLAYLVANVLDGERQTRMQEQMRVLADIADAFSQAEEGERALEALATALARASRFAWVVILLFDAAIENVVERGINVARHSNTETAAQGREGREADSSPERDIRVGRHLAWTRQPYCVPDVSDPSEQMLVTDDLRPYYERAHILSLASYPVFFRDQMLGTITFCGADHHQFDEQEREFLWTLVAQAAPTIKAYRLNRELREAEQRLRAVFSNAPVFITVFDADGVVVLSEGAGLARLGQRAGELVGRSIYETTPRSIHEQMRTNIARGMAGESFDSDMATRQGDFQTRFAPLRDELGVPTGVIGVTMDMTQQYKAQRALHQANQELQAAKENAEKLALQAEYLACHDALTGVLSRRAWFAAAAAQSRPSAIAVFDIDRFKAINDRYGHPTGDLVLRMVAERIAGAVEGAGALGRLGGEEFGVLFDGSPADAEAACQRAVEAVAGTPCGLPDGVTLTVTVSAGLAGCRRVTDDAPDAIARAYDMADRALYEAKEGGRHRLVVSDRAA